MLLALARQGDVLLRCAEASDEPELHASTSERSDVIAVSSATLRRDTDIDVGCGPGMRYARGQRYTGRCGERP
ncbi:hypothetical protein GCM10027059_23260 [Myceligenerans halotolerans]